MRKQDYFILDFSNTGALVFLNTTITSERPAGSPQQAGWNTSKSSLKYTLKYSYISRYLAFEHLLATMRFTLPALLGLTLLTWHQALALPATPTKIAKVERDITTPYNVTIVDGAGASLGTPDDATWSSTPLQTRLLFVMPLAIANDMGIMRNTLPFRLLLSYTGSSAGDGHVFGNVFPEDGQAVDDLDICFGTSTVVGTGTSGGNSWVQIQSAIEVAWGDTITNKLIAVFWTGTYQYGQNDPSLSYTTVMNIVPSGWEQSGSLPASGCPQSGVGTVVNPTSWSNLPWSNIISNLQ